MLVRLRTASVAMAVAGLLFTSSPLARGASLSLRPVSISQAPAAACTTTGYSKNCSGCVKITSRGTFTVKVARTNVSVKGKDSARSVGTTLCLARVAVPVPSKGGVGVRVTATGRFEPLQVTAKKARVYSYTPKSKRLSAVKTIARPGIYQIIGS